MGDTTRGQPRRGFLRASLGFLLGAAVGPAVADAAGDRHASLLSGSGAPSRHAGSIGDFYIETRGHLLYGPKRTHGWGAPTSLVGARGPAGGAGREGPRGYSVLHGSSPPAPSLGEDGDFYIDVATTQLYGPRSGGVWGSPVSLTATDNRALAATPEALFVGAVSCDVFGAPIAAAVLWPDGTEGTYAGVSAASAAGAIDSFTVTYGAITYTQPTVTREGNGQISFRPPITES